MELPYRLLEVSRSGYCERLQRRPSLRERQNQAISRRLIQLRQRNPAWGLDSLYHMIRGELFCSRKRIHRLINELRIAPCASERTGPPRIQSILTPSRPTSLRAVSPYDKPDAAGVGNVTFISPPMRAGSIALSSRTLA